MTENATASGAAGRTDRLFQWLGLLANVGVLLGLVLVIVQINQSTQLARAAYRNEGNVAWNQMWASMMDGRLDAVSKSVECPNEMTHDDFLALDAYLFSALNMLYRDYQLAQEGLYTEDDWKRAVELYAHWYLANPMGRAWWDELARSFFPQEFSEHVDETLKRSGADHHAYWRAIRARAVSDAGDSPTVCRLPGQAAP
ncbi:MAG: hypothetical protein HC850_15665 [Rhodomicrobium sp.]|nr:hypothetical protein [Rhodomicrobium sp.]